jgi:hypothetical protein
MGRAGLPYTPRRVLSIMRTMPDDVPITSCRPRRMEAAMVQRPCFRLRWLHCALIALAMQGMKPDPQDLVSGTIARILESIPGDRMSPKAAGELPPGEDATDDTPDEICTPASSSIGRVEQGRDAPASRGLRVGHSARTMASAPRHATPPLPAPSNRRLASLGRLTC